MEYIYKSLGTDGTVLQGNLEAKDVNEVLTILRSRGQKPIKIEKKEEKSKEITFGTSKLKLKELILFCRQTSTMLSAGMSLNRCLDVLIKQNENPKMKKLLTEIATSIQKGETLTGALEKERKFFPELFRRTIAAGEITGQLPEVFEKMAIHYEKEQKIRRKIKAAMMYPIILSIVAVISVTILLVGVMPKFIAIFEGAGVEFPKLTLAVIGLSRFITKNGVFVVIAVVALIFAIKKIFSIKNVRLRWDFIKLQRLWMLKEPITKVATARFTRTLSTLISSGITIIPSIETAGETTQNTYLDKSMEGVIAGVEKGMSLTSQFEETKIFPPMMISMIGIGEESGNLEGMLEKTADYYDEEMEAALQQLVSMIEPLMIVIMAAVIGTIVIAMYLPMFDSFKTLQG